MFGKIFTCALAAGVAIVLVPADPAEARSKRFRFQPFYGAFHVVPRYARPRYYYDYYEPHPFARYEDQGYYEPEYYSPPPRKLKKKKVGKAPAKNKLASATAEKSDEGKNASAGTLIACDKAQSIVGGYGFEGVKASDCEGELYTFTAKRGGKPYSIKLSSVSGELTEVKKVE